MDNPLIKPGTCWRHRNGNAYQIIAVSNQPNEERYPLTVVYRGIDNDRIWSRRADDWERSMTHAPDIEETIPNATFTTFKASGKYYTEGRGRVNADIFEPFHGGVQTREALLKINSNKVPGLSTTGSNFHVIIVMDPWVDFGWPLHLNAVSGDD